MSAAPAIRFPQMYDYVETFKLAGSVFAAGAALVATGYALFNVRTLRLAQNDYAEKGQYDVQAAIQTLKPTTRADPEERQYLLLKEYHSQGLAQSMISFWFSLAFASIGFLVIVMGLVKIDYKLPISKQTANFIPIMSGTIIDAVSALFFVQSNRARQLMSDFFDKLRTDRKLDESLALLKQIEDGELKSRVQVLLTLQFSNVQVNDALLTNLLSLPGSPIENTLESSKPGSGQGEKKPDEPKPEVVVRALKAEPLR